MDAGLTMEKRIRAELAGFDGRVCVYLDDLKGNVVAIDADEPCETASTVKTYILACLFDEAEKGNADLEGMLTLTPDEMADGSGVLKDLGPGVTLSVRNTATLMIAVSDNIATNMMIDFLGLDRINACIRALGCGGTALHNPIHFDRYEHLGTTTARDYGSMFVRLAKRELISSAASEGMLSIFRKQHYNSTLTRYFPAQLLDEDAGDPDRFYVASKSGSMDNCRNDGGIVHTPYGDYVIVLMAKDFADPLYYNDHPAMEYGARVSRMVLDTYLSLEGRFVL